MRISIDTPNNLTSSDIKNINKIAAAGFGQEETKEMLEDTQEHIRAADFIQRSYIEGEEVGFALYKRLLWQSCY